MNIPSKKEPPLPQKRTTDEMHRPRCCPPLHKCVEEREIDAVAKKGEVLVA
jgi:hypothetical protein